MHSCLKVYPSLYDRKPLPNFGPRKIIGYIGLSNLKFARKIANTTVSLDLNHNIDQAILKDQTLDVKLTELIKYLLENEIRLNFFLENKLENAQFFCYRGLLSIIAYTPYENNEPWKIVAVLYKGDIYLCRRKTEEQLQKILNMTPKEKMFTSWGYKFEQYMLSDTPDSQPNPDLPVDETEEFSLVFSTRLNQHKIVFGAEMDGIMCDNEVVPPPPQDSESIINYLSSKKFIELKTSRHLEYEKQHRNFWRFKALKWWCQSFFVGIDTILCGFRNDAGIVENLEVFGLDQLKSKSKRFWTPNGCLNFLDTFLSHVKSCLAKEIRRKHGDSAVNKLQTIPLTSLMFEWTPGSIVKVNPEYRHENDPILFDWFLNQYGKSRKSVDAQMSSTK